MSQPGSACSSTCSKIIGMAFVISAPCIEYALYHDSIAAKVIEIVLTVHVSHMFHHIAIFRLEIIIILPYFLSSL